MVRFFDTLAGEVVDFVPARADSVSMYVCGPTVYDDPHLGHARTALTFDMVRRYLLWRGYDVVFVSNVTDIDDKIIARAAEEGTTEPDLAARYEAVYIDQMGRMGVLDPTHRPHATDYVEQMIAVIAELVDADRAYAVPGRGVYYSVAADDGYGRLVHRSADDLREGAGARVDVDTEKADPLDFALWKAAKPGEPSWPSPWGDGRPGWHIECVAMAIDLLGDEFDIHGGGDDLVFPHHENEVAEAVGAGRPFARHWIHGSMLNIAGEKMSKSLGNFVTLADVLERHDPRALRLLMLQSHYRTVMEISDDALTAAGHAIERLDAWHRRAAALGLPSDGPVDDAAVSAFRAAMDDDFASPTALAVVFDLVRDGHAAADADDRDRAGTTHRTIVELTGALGLAPPSDDRGEDADKVDALVAQRQEARAAKDFATADRIRDELAAQGIVIEDTAQGPIWRREG